MLCSWAAHSLLFYTHWLRAFTFASQFQSIKINSSFLKYVVHPMLDVEKDKAFLSVSNCRFSLTLILTSAFVLPAGLCASELHCHRAKSRFSVPPLTTLLADLCVSPQEDEWKPGRGAGSFSRTTASTTLSTPLYVVFVLTAWQT